MNRAGWAALAVAALWLPFALRSAGARTREPAPERAVAPPVAIGEGQGELARIRASLVRAERRLSQLETAPHEPVGQAEPDTAVVPVQPPAGEVSDEQRRGRVAQAFESESVDPDWKPERALDGALREALPPGSSVHAIECRSSLCRVETSHPDADSQRAYVNAIALPQPDRVRPFDGVLFDTGEPLANGPALRSVTYFVRPGRELPAAPP